MASPATTGSSTSNPSAMTSAAIETCQISIPSAAHIPRVMATAIGIDSATIRALRHSMNSMATTTTMTIASTRQSRNSSILCRTCSGSSLVRSTRRSSGRRPASEASAASTSRENSCTCVPFTCRTASVMARVVVSGPASALTVRKLSLRGGSS